MTTDETSQTDFGQNEPAQPLASPLGTFVLAAMGFGIVGAIAIFAFGHWILFG